MSDRAQVNAAEGLDEGKVSRVGEGAWRQQSGRASEGAKEWRARNCRSGSRAGHGWGEKGSGAVRRVLCGRLRAARSESGPFLWCSTYLR